MKILKIGVSPFRYLIRDFSATKKLIQMKLSQEQMKPIYKPGVKVLEEIFTKNGYEVRIAGGAVRDMLMGKIPCDLDFATTATPEQMLKMFEDEQIRVINMGGMKHGTISARIKEENFEITTLRIDKSTDGRHAQVEFVTDWELDAGRRDLTINCLYLGLDGTVYDHHNGIQHINEGVIRFVGDADKRIKEDYLRILRYFRFFGKISRTPDDHDPETLSIIKHNVEGLGIISGERIWIEVKKIITGRFGIDALLKMEECNIFPLFNITKPYDRENLLRMQSLWEGSEVNPCKLSPASILAAGFKTVEDAVPFIQRMKCSNKEKESINFIIQHRQDLVNAKHFKVVTDFYVDLVYEKKKDRKVVLFLLKETLIYTAKVDFLSIFDTFTFPVFPIKGSMFFDMVKNKRDIKTYFAKSLEIWKESDYLLDAEEILVKIKHSH